MADRLGALRRRRRYEQQSGVKPLPPARVRLVRRSSGSRMAVGARHHVQETCSAGRALATLANEASCLRCASVAAARRRQFEPSDHRRRTPGGMACGVTATKPGRPADVVGTIIYRRLLELELAAAGAGRGDRAILVASDAQRKQLVAASLCRAPPAPCATLLYREDADHIRRRRSNPASRHSAGVASPSSARGAGLPFLKLGGCQCSARPARRSSAPPCCAKRVCNNCCANAPASKTGKTAAKLAACKTLAAAPTPSARE